MTTDVRAGEVGVVPKLGEPRIDVNHHAAAKGSHQSLERQVTADVDQRGLRRDRNQLLERGTDNCLRQFVEQRGSASEPESLGDRAEPRGRLGLVD